MEWHPAKQALTYLRLTTAGLTLVTAIGFGIAACLLSPWWWLGCPVIAVVGLLLFWWYCPRYLTACTARCDEHRLRIRYGVLWQKEQHIPLHALRTFSWWDDPLARRFGCRTLYLRYAGGFALVPLLSREAAARLHRRLTEMTV